MSALFTCVSIHTKSRARKAACVSVCGAHDRRPCPARLERQLGQAERHPRKHVDDNLLRNAGARAAKDDVAAEQAGDEGVGGAGLAVG